MFCWNCGKEIEDNAKFCPYCGKPGKRPTSQSPSQTPPQAEQTHREPEQKKPPKKNTGKTVGVVALLLLLVCAAVGIVAGKRNGAHEDTPSGTESTAISAEETKPEEAESGSTENEPTEEAGSEEGGSAEVQTEAGLPEENAQAAQDTELEAFLARMPEEIGAVDEEDLSWLLPNSNRIYYTEEMIEQRLNEKGLRMACNEIYARRGRKFKSEEVKDYFEQMEWYQPVFEPEEFDAMGDRIFNEYELANRNLILKMEEARKSASGE